MTSKLCIFPFSYFLCRNRPFDGGAKSSKPWAKAFASKGENEWSHHQRLFEEDVRKTKKDKGLWILKMRVQELFTHGEGISVSHARHKGRQPLIECANHDFKIVYFSLFVFFMFFPFYVFYFFGVDKGIVLAPTYPPVR